MTKEKTFSSYLKSLAKEGEYIRVLQRWKVDDQYPAIIDGNLLEVGEDYLTMDRSATDFEKTQKDSTAVHIVVPLSSVIQIIVF